VVAFMWSTQKVEKKERKCIFLLMKIGQINKLGEKEHVGKRE